ncbi:MAG TPA: BTAD domain-containing putative transcriptional regulator [Streptosporangiaceae bacterium]|nr:BTAD domain-containing putative transcriptional regulator [Streptosporangiaceae bacterium]
MSSELRFAVLGPVRAWRGDVELDVGAPQQQAVLAMLLLAEGRQVTLDALISGLWDDDPPLAATGTVRTYVSRLRRRLGSAGRDGATGVIESAGAGYVLPAHAGALDLDIFTRLTKDAQRERASGPAGMAKAAALLHDALELGQGVPLAGVPGPYAESQRVRITEFQLAATEERLALDIELGGHVAAAAELRSLLASHPMRERLSELLMLGLYRSGRQADALAVFDRTRRLLGEELGIDPGPGLREMHQRILEMDQSLIGPAQPPQIPETVPDAPLPVPLVAPAQLPTDLSAFAGRQRELARLDSLLNDGAQSSGAVVIAAIDGMAGIGKTALAVHWAHRAADRFPDGQLYVNLRGFDPSGAVMSPGDALRGFLETLGVAPQRIPGDFGAQASLYRSMLNGRRILVLVDNARDIEQVRPLLPGSPGCLVLITSRNRLPGLITAHGAHAVSLDTLPADEARQVMALRLGSARLAAEPDASDEIIDRCGGLPLAMAVVAARATVYQDLPLAEIASELRDARTRLDALSADDAAADVRAVFSWSYRLLSVPARRLFRLLSVHGGPELSRNAAASLAGLPRAGVQPLLAELAGARLLTEHRPGRFTSHDLTRVYAAELSATEDTDDDRRAGLGRLLDYYLYTSYRAHLLLWPNFAAPDPGAAQPEVTPDEPSGYQQAMGWFATEREALQAAVRHAGQSGFCAHAWQLALTLQQFYQRQGHWYDWATTMRTALRAALDAGDFLGQAYCRRSLAGACHLLGQDIEAVAELERARELSGETGGTAEQACLHSIFGAILRHQGAYEESVARYQQAYALCTVAGHRTGQADALEGIGSCYGSQGRYGEATGLVHEAMAIYRELGNPNGEGDCWVRLGEFHYLLGEHEQAASCYRRAVALWRRLGNRADEAATLVSLGDSALAAGKPAQAREAWESAVTILTELGLPAASSVCRKLASWPSGGSGTLPSSLRDVS